MSLAQDWCRVEDRDCGRVVEELRVERRCFGRSERARATMYQGRKQRPCNNSRSLEEGMAGSGSL
jgi:hypothetical protein